jgi:IS5 family transposase
LKEFLAAPREAWDLVAQLQIGALPVACDWGCKKNSKGKVEWTKGYKLHVEVDDNGIPLTAVLTGASPHDSQVALPVTALTAGKVTGLYELKDAAYDAAPIREFARSLGHVPIIDQNPRRGEVIPMDPATARRYQGRTTAEQFNARLKDEFGGRFVRVRGTMKVYTHLMFGVLVIAADQLIRMVT